jgi:hypothetical protein
MYSRRSVGHLPFDDFEFGREIAAIRCLDLWAIVMLDVILNGQAAGRRDIPQKSSTIVSACQR